MKIAISGYSRSGKDTVCELIKKHTPFYVNQMGFGDAMKNELYRMFPTLSHEPKPRKEMEIFAQSMREIQPDIWVEKLENRIEYCERSLQLYHFIINDLRQPNEYEWLKQNGFTIINVVSPINQRAERSVNDNEFQAVTESEKNLHLVPFDYQVMNKGTIKELEDQIVEILKRLEGENK